MIRFWDFKLTGAPPLLSLVVRPLHAYETFHATASRAAALWLRRPTARLGHQIQAGVRMGRAATVHAHRHLSRTARRAGVHLQTLHVHTEPEDVVRPRYLRRACRA